jgi:hypothetical protein
MKNYSLTLLVLFSLIISAQAQDLKLQNALVIGQLDKQEDRYSLEINLTEMLSEAGVKAMPSLNVLKLGSDASILASDSVQKVLAAKGIDTYVLISIRGYDRKFKKSVRVDDLTTVLQAGNLFPLYRDEVTSVCFEFLFYRNGKFVKSDILKCGNVSDRDSVIKRFRKKVSKRISKNWLN